jgi:pSer/pThr/pTyr-binding forkhead associated (FHA) protein
VSVGCAEANRIRITDSSVSRGHCRIDRQEDEFLIRNLGSQKGTRVN